MKRINYFYVLKDPITKEIRYFGRTVNPKRRLYEHIRESKIENTYKCCWIKSLSSDPILEIIYEEKCTLKEAIQVEKTILRKLMKRYNLTNSWDNCVGVNKTGIKVYQYSLNGDFIKTFENANHACIETGIIDSNISRSCKNSNSLGSISAGGYYWLHKKHNVFPFPKGPKKHSNYKTVVQKTMDGKYIQTFETATEAGRMLGIGNKLISRVCTGEREHTCGI